MSRTIFFFIIGIFILKSSICWGLEEPDPPEWWETALIYELAPQSFKDSDSDGYGDFQGIIDQLWYFEYLKVDVICLHSIFSWGYGASIANHNRPHIEIGGIEGFDRLVKETHSRGMKIILDFGPFQTSHEHSWFGDSAVSRTPEKDFYKWTVEPPPDDPAWKFNDERGAWYHFKSTPSSPTLNLGFRDVVFELNKALEFWLTKQVDGFRITDLPFFLDAKRSSVEEDILKINMQYLYMIRSVVDKWTKSNNSTSKYVVVETNEPPEQWQKYYGTKEKPGLSPLNYLLTSIDRNAIGNKNATELKIDLEKRLKAVPPNATINWMLSQRNGTRITTRVGKDTLDVYLMLSMLLPGQAYTYFGDEIGMDDTVIGHDVTDENYRLYKNAMQWEPSSTAGFTNNTSFRRVRINQQNAGVNVKEQKEDPRSHLAIYKKLAELRKHDVFRRGRWELKTLNDDAVLVLRRDLDDGSDIYLVILNLSDVKKKINLQELNWDLDESLNVEVSSYTNDLPSVHRDSWDMPAKSGIVLTSSATREDKGGEDDRNSEANKGEDSPQVSTEGGVENIRKYPEEPNRPGWWETALIYELAPLSFKDSDNDGFGDFQGIIYQLWYFEELKVDVICLHSIYLSDSEDYIINHTDVNSQLGDIGDFDRLVSEAHSKGIKIILDFLPYHTSDQHPWFKYSKQSKSPYKDFYIWIAQPPPNDPAWEFNAERGEWYHYKTTKHSPILNLKNRNVCAELKNILEFWLARKVDGFRITKLPLYLATKYSSFDTEILKKNVDYLYEIRSVVDEWTKLNNSTSKYMVVDTKEPASEWDKYYGTNDKPGMLPSNNLLTTVDRNSNVTNLMIHIKSWLDAIPLNSTTNWMLSNQDGRRLTLRVGDDMLDIYMMLGMLLPGQVYTYFGDEIGMVDHVMYNGTYSYKYAMQWENAHTAGFTNNTTSGNIPINRNNAGVNVEDQRNNRRSHLAIYKKLAELRKHFVFGQDRWDLKTLNNDTVLVLRRDLDDGSDIYLVILNLSDVKKKINLQELNWDLDESLNVEVSSYTNDLPSVHRDSLDMPAKSGIVLTSSATREDKGGEDDRNSEANKGEDSPQVSTEGGVENIRKYPEESNRPGWWETALIYELAPLSFKDSDNDGFGDFQGIIDQLWYFEELKVDVICLHSIYLSDSEDYIINHTDVNSQLGDIGDFDRLVSEAHSKGIKIILDFLPYHTSDQHPWFKYSKQSKPPYKDFYIWIAQPPPNDLAWEFNAERGEWYHYKTTKHSPILNLKNRNVCAELKNILEFWLARKVDGFRITKLPLYLATKYSSFDTEILKKNVDYLYEIRSVVDEWTKLNNSTSKYMVVDTKEPASEWDKYYGTNDKPGMLPSNNLLTTVDRNSNVTNLMIHIKSWLDAIPLNSTTNWMLSNQDGRRLTLRVGDDMLDIYMMLGMLLPGQVYTYFGDEIGMVDHVMYNGTYSYKYAMQWENAHTAGFTNNTTSGNIPINRNNAGVNVEDQRNNRRSHLAIYKKLAELRKHFVFGQDRWDLKTLNNDTVLVLRRDLDDGSDIYLVILNLSDVKKKINLQELNWDLDESLNVEVSSYTNDLPSVHRDSLDMPAKSGIVLTSSATREDKGGEDDRNSEANKGEDSPQVSTEGGVENIRKYPEESNRPGWWETALIYELAPLSFKDSDNDGFGDFQGIIDQLWYFEELKVDVICLHSIYLSDSEDYIINHTDVNSQLGDIGDFDRLVSEAHSKGIKIILDFLPYHTSDQHPWFKYSKQSKFPYKDFYIWIAQPPPNDPAWEFSAERGEWYHYKTTKHSPILNLKNRNVCAELKNILEFWLARKVDGFRITGLPLYLDTNYSSFDTEILKKNVDYLYEIRSVVDEWTKLNNSTSKYMVVETNEPALQWIKDHDTNDKPGLLPSNNLLTSIDRESSATNLMIQIKSWLDAVPLNSTTNWMLSNQDGQRITSRVGDDMLDIYLMLGMLLPGQAYTYFGDEIGMVDHVMYNGTYSYKYAMQWENAHTAGFTNNTTSGNIPINRNNADVNVADQRNNLQSHLAIYKKLAELRKHFVFGRDRWDLKTLNNDTVLVLRRDLGDGSGIYLVILNLSSVTRRVNLRELHWELDESLSVEVYSHTDDSASLRWDALDIAPKSGIALKSQTTREGRRGKGGRNDGYDRSGEKTKTIESTDVRTRIDNRYDWNRKINKGNESIGATVVIVTTDKTPARERKTYNKTEYSENRKSIKGKEYTAHIEFIEYPRENEDARERRTYNKTEDIGEIRKDGGFGGSRKDDKNGGLGETTKSSREEDGEKIIKDRENGYVEKIRKDGENNNDRGSRNDNKQEGIGESRKDREGAGVRESSKDREHGGIGGSRKDDKNGGLGETTKSSREEDGEKIIKDRENGDVEKIRKDGENNNDRGSRNDNKQEGIGESRKDREGAGVRESSKDREHGGIGESRKDDKNGGLGETTKSSREEDGEKIIKDRENGDVEKIRKDGENNNDRGSRNDNKQEGIGESRKDREGAGVRESSKDREHGGIGESRKDDKNGGLGETTKSSREEDGEKIIKDRENGDVEKIRKDGENNYDRGSRNDNKQEGIGESRKDREGAGVRESSKHREHGGIGESRKDDKNGGLGETTKSSREEDGEKIIKDRENGDVEKIRKDGENKDARGSRKDNKQEGIGESRIDRKDSVGGSRKKGENGDVRESRTDGEDTAGHGDEDDRVDEEVFKQGEGESLTGQKVEEYGRQTGKNVMSREKMTLGNYFWKFVRSFVAKKVIPTYKKLTKKTRYPYLLKPYLPKWWIRF